ncbi:MAG: serine/threonine protein kinase [Candidatus Competibacterales bacterium]
MSTIHASTSHGSLGDYRLDRLLSSEELTVNYRAWDLARHVPVVVTEYFPSAWAQRQGELVVPNDQGLMPSPDEALPNFAWGLEQFLAEARALAQLHHPHVAHVQAHFTANGTAYAVTEEPGGESLAARLDREGTLGAEILEPLLHQALMGLATIHAQGLLHWDINPETLHWRGDGGGVIITGIAAAHQRLGRARAVVSRLLNPGYSAPEQYAVRGDHCGAWTDLFALGAVAYRCIVGEPPREAAERLLDDTLVSVVEAGHDRYPRPLLQAVARALELDYRRRFASALQMAAAVEDTAKEPSLPPEDPAPEADLQGVRFSAPPRSTPPRPVDWSKTVDQVVISGVFYAGILAAATGAVYWANSVHRAPSDDAPGLPSLESLVDAPRFTGGGTASAEIAPSPEAVPALQETLDPSQAPLDPSAAAQVEQWLAQAQTSLERLRLTTPNDDSALHYYQQVLTLDPDNPEARRGFSRIAEGYAQLAQREIDRANYPKALDFIEVGLAIKPDFEPLATLRAAAEVQSEEASPVEGQGHGAGDNPASNLDTPAAPGANGPAFPALEGADRRARLWIHAVHGDQKALGRELLDELIRLGSEGKQVIGKPVQVVAAGPARSQLRYFKDQDAAGAAELYRVLKLHLPNLELRDFSPRYERAQWIKPGHYELWFSSNPENSNR